MPTNCGSRADGPVALWGYSQGGGASAAAAELASGYAPELHLVGTYSGAPGANLSELWTYWDGNIFIGVVGYILNGLIAAYPKAEAAIHDRLTPQGEDLLNKSKEQCFAETILTFGLHHLQGYFVGDPYQVLADEPFKSLFDLQRIGRLKPNSPVFIDSNHFDPLVPWTGANQLGRDWCAQGADVQFWTNRPAPIPQQAVGQPRASRLHGRRATPPRSAHRLERPGGRTQTWQGHYFSC